MKNSPKVTDDQLAEVLTNVAEGASVAGESRRLGVSRSTLREAIARFERESTERQPAGVEAEEDGALVVTSEPLTVAGVELTEDGLMRQYGLDPDEHEIVRKRLNFWGSDADPHFQLRLDVIPRNLLILPELDREWLPAPEPVAASDGGKRVVIVTDYHAPHYDRGLHQVSLQFMRDYGPQLILNLGDLADNASISRHRERLGQVQHVNDCIVHGGTILRDTREAAPNAEMVLLPGNHDDRLQHTIIDNNRALLGIRGFNDEYDALDWRRLWDLDPIHVKMLTDDWDRAKYSVSKHLVAIHGKRTTKTAGEDELTKRVRSIVQGHSHRIRFTYRTQHDDPDTRGGTRTRVAVECGTMAQIEHSLYYGDEENWQQGFVYGTIWPDGKFALAPALYVNNTLLLADGTRYDATVDSNGDEL